MYKVIRRFSSFAVAVLCLSSTVHAGELADGLRKLDGRVIVLGTVREPPLAGMLARDLRAGLRLANQREIHAWEQVKTKADWERCRDSRLQALRASLGQYPPPPKEVKVRRTGAHKGDGFTVANLVFESRPGLVVTANLYRPAPPAKSMPGILVVHSHQQPKHTGWRQDMGMTWARAGCLVLVPDLLGHGERRQHPFRMEADFPQPFPLRQDYYCRYDAAIQLDLIGDSLMGWFAWDLARCVDVLLAQPGIDPKRIIAVSEPAGGGDPAAVAAALDSRLTGAVITNFGGPQPETPYPLPRDAELSFEYAGGGSWESTRNLKLSARDGFLPWVIVAASAPRYHVYNHEFYWDRERDPVWKRLQKVWSFYGASDRLTGIAGHGFVVGSSPENTHWIPLSRELFYPVLERWFAIPNPKKEYSQRMKEEDLLCLTADVVKELKPRPLHALAEQIGGERTAKSRAELAKLTPEARRERLRRDWGKLLGDGTPMANPVVVRVEKDAAPPAGVAVERIHLQTEPGIVVPVLLLTPLAGKEKKLPVVVALAQGGKQEFLKQRADAIADLLGDGIAVCLPDVRGSGETSPGESRDRTSAATSLSATGWMLGQPLVGSRLRDLRSVLRHLRQRPELDSKRLALWGDSFTPPNPADRNPIVPHGIANRPGQAEPLGGLLALLAALYDEDVRAVSIRGGLASYQSALQGPFCYLPHDALIPGVLTAGDLADVAAALSPRPLRLEAMVDGLNRMLTAEALARSYEPALAAYRQAKAPDRLALEPSTAPPSPAKWLAGHLKR